jgi:hypothetical protein
MQVFGFAFSANAEVPTEFWTVRGGNASFLLFPPQIRGHELGVEEG